MADDTQMTNSKTQLQLESNRKSRKHLQQKAIKEVFIVFTFIDIKLLDFGLFFFNNLWGNKIIDSF